MTSEWTCSRCQTVNPATAASCELCGASRHDGVTVPVAPPPPGMVEPAAPAGEPPGAAPAPPVAPAIPEEATPPAVGEPGWIPAAEAPATKRSALSRIPWGWIVVGVFVLGGAVVGWMNTAGRSDTGEINKAGELAPTDLRVGDCFDLAEPEASEVEKTAAKPCAEPHAYEVFFTGEMPAGEYPAESAFQEYVDANCVPAFTTYVGTSYESSTLDVLWFFPSDEGWRENDRTIQCSLYDPPAGTQVTGSLKGSGQ